MRTYLVERNVIGIDIVGLIQMSATAHRFASLLRQGGTQICYLGSTFLPDAARCHCLFEASNENAVVRLNHEADLDFDKIRPAITFAAAALPYVSQANSVSDIQTPRCIFEHFPHVVRQAVE